MLWLSLFIILAGWSWLLASVIPSNVYIFLSRTHHIDISHKYQCSLYSLVPAPDKTLVKGISIYCCDWFHADLPLYVVRDRNLMDSSQSIISVWDCRVDMQLRRARKKGSNWGLTPWLCLTGNKDPNSTSLPSLIWRIWEYYVLTAGRHRSILLS